LVLRTCALARLLSSDILAVIPAQDLPGKIRSSFRSADSSPLHRQKKNERKISTSPLECRQNRPIIELNVNMLMPLMVMDVIDELYWFLLSAVDSPQSNRPRLR
jgi:hypothetical protein